MAFPTAIVLAAGTLPFSALHVRHQRADAPLLLFLYVAVTAGAIGWLTLPSIGWMPGTASLFGVQEVDLAGAR